jgi:predicted GTPase
MERLKELEDKGVYNLTSEELDELQELVRVEMVKFPDKLKASVDKACEAIQDLLNRWK